MNATKTDLFSGTIDFDTIADRIEQIDIDGSPAEQRAGYSKLLLGDDLEPDTTAGGIAQAGDLDLNGVPARLFEPTGTASTTQTIVWFHGGGLVFGSPETHARLAQRLADATGFPVFVPRYRRAPEHLWPKQFDDAQAVIAALRERGFEKIALGGDSAGGHLSLVMAMAENRFERPVQAVVAFSPDTDRSGKSDTREANTPKDAMNAHEDDLKNAEIAFGADFPKDNPQMSPLLDDLSLLPPTHLEVGSVEVLLGESQLVHEWGTEQGADVSLHVEPDAFHMWQLWTPWLPQANQSIDRAAQFLKKQLGA